MSRKSQSEGDWAEQAAQLSFNQYQAAGRLVWFKTFPEILVLYRGPGQKPDVVITGEANPDYLFCLQGGRFMWLEIKTWQALNQHTETRRLHQYRQMRESEQAEALAFYLVAWKWNGDVDWRLHPVSQLKERDGGLVFLREDGWPMDASEGWPDWWKAMAHLLGWRG